MIYQTAEDGLADTIVPRLEMVGADLNHVLTIDDAGKALTLNDGRLEKAIRQNKAKLLILDPVQAFLGARLQSEKEGNQWVFWLEETPSGKENR